LLQGRQEGAQGTRRGSGAVRDRAIPSVQDAWGNAVDGASATRTVPMEAKQAAARDFANKTMLEQQKAGVARPTSGCCRRATSRRSRHGWTTRRTPAARTPWCSRSRTRRRCGATIGRRSIARSRPRSGPLVRVIGSGVSGQRRRGSSTELAPQKLSDILKDESTEKSNQVKKDVLTAFTPFIKSMAGNEGGVGLFNDFRAQGEKLSAYYIVQRHESADAAAKKPSRS
jgi:hypothetical protein